MSFASLNKPRLHDNRLWRRQLLPSQINKLKTQLLDLTFFIFFKVLRLVRFNHYTRLVPAQPPHNPAHEVLLVLFRLKIKCGAGHILLKYPHCGTNIALNNATYYINPVVFRFDSVLPILIQRTFVQQNMVHKAIERAVNPYTSLLLVNVRHF